MANPKKRELVVDMRGMWINLERLGMKLSELKKANAHYNNFVYHIPESFKEDYVKATKQALTLLENSRVSSDLEGKINISMIKEGDRAIIEGKVTLVYDAQVNAENKQYAARRP